MMKLNFVKLNPAGNTTALILDPLPRNMYQMIARQLLKHESLSVEQVGFLERPVSEKAVARLQMMGGEFCGNATRALAAYFALKDYSRLIQAGLFNQTIPVPLEVSGYDGIIEANVYWSASDQNLWSEATMPLPKDIITASISIDNRVISVPVVDFHGIKHIVLLGFEPAEEIYHTLSSQVSVSDALGIMFYSPEKNYMIPLVGVKATESIVWEGSCGSGTVALAAVLAAEKGISISNLVVKQPGGEIIVDCSYENGIITEAVIKGPVQMVAEGQVWLNF